MDIRERIIENLAGRVAPVAFFVALKGVEEEGPAELEQMRREGIVEAVGALGEERRGGTGLFRLTMKWTNRDLDFG